LHFPFLGVFDSNFLLETSLSSHVLGMIGITGLVFSYELANRKLRVARDFEQQQFEFLASHDELTGLPNRRKFESLISDAIASLGVSNKKDKLALLYLDLDGFKPINDQFGHK